MKRILPSAFLVAALLAAGTSASTFATPACACGTWSGLVLSALNHVSRQLHSYVEHHEGLFPPPAEVARMLEGTRFYDGLLTSHFEVSAEPFKLVRFQHEGPQIAYAVSPDRTHAILVGMGVSEERLRLHFFGRKVDEWLTGRHSYPLLQPGQPLPPDSAPG